MATNKKSIKEINKSNLPDTQGLEDTRNLPINKVGIKDILHPMIIKQRSGKEQTTVANFNMYVNLPHDFKGTHILNMFSSSSESLANFRGTLTGEKWNLYTSGLRGKIRGVRAVAGNALAYTNIDKVGPIGQAWLFKVHAKDNIKFVNAFNKLLKTMKPNGFLATGQFTHGTDDGESTFVYGTSEDLNEAFSGGPSNNKEAQALQTFFEEIHYQNCTF